MAQSLYNFLKMKNDPVLQSVKIKLESLGNINAVFGIDDKNRFIEFEISGKGRGVYSVKLDRIILNPGSNYEIEVDDPMGLIYYKTFAATNFTKINFDGTEIV